MPKNKCLNCGAPLLESFAPNGTPVLICSRIPARSVKSGIGNYRHIEIYCQTGINDTHEETDAVFRFEKEVKTSTKVDAMRKAFDQLTKDTDLTLEQLREATLHTASDEALLKNANLAITLGLPANELPKLFNGAMRLGYAMGIDTEKAIQSLAIGIGRQSYMVLDNIGIVFRSQVAYEWYKQQTNKTKLSAIEKREAWIRYAIEQVKLKANKLNLAQTETSKTRFERIQAHLKNASVTFGKKVFK